MATITGTRKLNDKGYPDAWKGTEIQYQQGTTVADIIQLGHADSEAGVVRAFYNQLNIKASPELRTACADAATTIADLVRIMQGQCYRAEKQSGGGRGNPEALKAAAATRAENKVKAARFDTIAAKAAANPRLAKMLADLEAELQG